MLDKIFVKIYFLLSFTFLFLLFLQNFLKVDFLYVTISLYWIIFIPFKNIFSNYFKKLFWNMGFRNLFLNLWFVLLFFNSIILYLLISDLVLFLLLLIYIYLIAFKINLFNLFSFWILLFFIFLLLYLFNSDISSIYLISSFYFILIWILYFFIDMYIDIKKFFSKNNILFLNLSFIVFILFFIFSLYFEWFFYLLPYLLIINLFFLNFNNDYKINFNSNNDYYKKDIIVLGLFLIIFIPIINDYMFFDETNIIILFTFLWFLLTYVWLNNLIPPSPLRCEYSLWKREMIKGE